MTNDDVLADYADLANDDILAALEFAALSAVGSFRFRDGHLLPWVDQSVKVRR
jgi:hypothetical protein